MNKKITNTSYTQKEGDRMRTLPRLILLVAMMVAVVSTVTPQNCSSVNYVTGLRGYVVGFNGSIKKTTNSGGTWAALTSGTDKALYGSSFVDSITGMVVGGDGLAANVILKTTDGTAWSAQTSGTTGVLYSVSMGNANIALTVGNSGSIRKTLNGGTAWSASTSGTTEHLRGVAMSGPTRGWAVGYGGTILKTIDSAATWVAQTSPVKVNLYGVHFTTVDTGVIVGEGGTILWTTTGGTNWAYQTSGTAKKLTWAYAVDGRTAFAVGDVGTILKTTNSGSTWVANSSNTIQELYGLSFFSTSVGFACGGTNTVLVTTNGGTLWAHPGDSATYTVAPATPALSKPDSASLGNGSTVTITWIAVTGVQAYQLQLSEGSGRDVATIFDDSTLTSVSQVVYLKPGANYSFRVRAKNTQGWSSYSGAWNFGLSAAAPGIAISKSAIAYGVVNFHQPVTDSVVVSNTGNAVLNITGVTSSSTQWTITEGAASIPAGTSKTYHIVMSPWKTKAETATITWSHNGIRGTSTMSVTGTGFRR
jgi:photosystem II stability/assembly factor-like uncharacterized protein